MKLTITKFYSKLIIQVNTYGNFKRRHILCQLRDMNPPPFDSCHLEYSYYLTRCSCVSNDWPQPGADGRKDYGFEYFRSFQTFVLSLSRSRNGILSKRLEFIFSGTKKNLKKTFKKRKRESNWAKKIKEICLRNNKAKTGPRSAAWFWKFLG